MWQYFQPNPCGLSTGDCTVRAISKALDISWDEAHDILSEFAKNMCDMPHKDWVWGAVLRANGGRQPKRNIRLRIRRTLRHCC